MKRLLFIILLLGVLCNVTGCDNEKDERGLYLIHSTFSVYSDEKDPMFMEYGVRTSIKEFLTTSNCLPDCVHDQDKPNETLSDGTAIYEYDVEGEKYYYIQCNKKNSKYHEGKDILIGKDKNKLISLC